MKTTEKVCKYIYECLKNRTVKRRWFVKIVISFSNPRARISVTVAIKCRFMGLRLPCVKRFFVTPLEKIIKSGGNLN